VRSIHVVSTATRYNCRMDEGRAQALRASLASATSLLALLLLEGREAMADPIFNVGASTPFYYALGSTWDAGTDNTNPGNATDNYRFTPLKIGAATMIAGYAESNPYFAIGQSPLEKLAVSDSSDGNLSSRRGTSSTGGADGTGNSVFVGTSGNLALLDSPINVRTTASASYGYTIPIPAKGAARMQTLGDGDDQTTAAGLPPTTEPGGAPRMKGSMAEGGHDVSQSTDQAVAATSTYNYTQFSPRNSTSAATGGIGGGTSAVTNPFQPSGPKDTGEERVFSGTVQGASVFNMRGPVAGVSALPASPGRASSAMHNEAVKAFYLILQRTTRDANPGDATPANRAIEGYTRTGADPTSFSIISLSDFGRTRRATVALPIKVVGSGSGELPSSLTIFIAESRASDEAADALSYFFDRGVVQ
jgi:hypothetical protein